LSIPCIPTVYLNAALYHKTNLRQSMAARRAKQMNNARSIHGDGRSGRTIARGASGLADAGISDTVGVGVCGAIGGGTWESERSPHAI